MYAGKQMKHTTKLFKNTSLKKLSFKTSNTVEKASKKDKNQVVFEKWDLPEEMPLLWDSVEKTNRSMFLTRYI